MPDLFTCEKCACSLLSENVRAHKDYHERLDAAMKGIVETFAMVDTSLNDLNRALTIMAGIAP